jgi:hypothetical protein
VTRRELLAATGLGLAATLYPRVFATPAALQLDTTRLSSEEQMWRDVVFMNGLGPRYTGNSAHDKFISFLDEKFAAAGFQVEHVPHSSLMRWDPIAWSIKTRSGTRIPVSSYCRFSRTTGPKGITAPLKYCGRIGGPSLFTLNLQPEKRSKLSIPSNISGKIALLERTSSHWPLQEMFGGHLRAVVDPTHAGTLPPIQRTIATYNAALLPTDFESELRKAGALGVIFAWVGVSDENAQGQWMDWLGEGNDLPMLWAAPTARKELRAIAEREEPVTLTIHADVVRNAPTRTIVATLPGSSEETTILWTHTDGNNAIEENGGIAIAHLAKYFAALPKDARRRTISCVLVEGHYSERYLPSFAWIKERPDLVERAVSVLSIEHLGCREWVDNPQTGTYAATERPEIAFAFSATGSIGDVMLKALENSQKGRTAVIDDVTNGFSPGLSAYGMAKIPTIGYIVTPPYLLAESATGHIEKMSSDQFYDEVKTMARTVQLLDIAPRAALRQGAGHLPDVNLLIGH